MKERLLLLDFSNVFYRAANVHTDLRHKGSYTGALYGFTQQLAAAITRTRPTVVVACDDRKPYLRRREYPMYKAGRSKAPKDRIEDLTKNRKCCQRLLDYLSIPIVAEKGLEADDIIAVLCADNSERFEEIAVFSNDSDLFQLLDQRNVSMYLKPQAARFALGEFLEKYPKLWKAVQWRDVRALAGGHNSVDGVPSVGEGRAMRIVTDPDYCKSMQHLLDKHANLIKRNRRLCTLPYPGVNHDVLEEISLPENDTARFSERDVISFLSRYGIKYMPAFHNAFSRIR